MGLIHGITVSSGTLVVVPSAVVMLILPVKARSGTVNVTSVGDDYRCVERILADIRTRAGCADNDNDQHTRMRPSHPGAQRERLLHSDS